MNRTEKQKRKEWQSIWNILPYIERFLNLTNIKYNSLYEKEGPDFVFMNNIKSIGIEVTECHPSVQKNKKYNAPARSSHEKRVCNAFLNNKYLLSITSKGKLNIIVDRGEKLEITSSIDSVCSAIENHLRAWKNAERLKDCRLIRKIRVMKTAGKNIVQFNSIARRDPIMHSDLCKCIRNKNNKLRHYSKKKCDEYWLCIHLPFEESRQSNDIREDNMKEEFISLLNSSKFDRICLTSVTQIDLIWLKGDPNLIPSQ